MQAIKGKISKPLPTNATLVACDNSGAKILKIIAVKRAKTRWGRKPCAGVGDLVWVDVVKGAPEIRKKVVNAVIVRQKKEYTRPNGMRIKFEDNAAIVLKDDLKTPKGTLFKGPIAKEACERWPSIAKIARIII